MKLSTVFKFSLYGLTGLVGVILGAAEGEGASPGSGRSEIVLPFLSIPMVVCGFLMTERRRRSPGSVPAGIGAGWANLLGIIALMATAREFMSKNSEGKLLAGTHLLLYATWIVLFQQKSVRSYWFLMALGILQLSVATVLTTKGWFGFCAVAYMFGAVWTLSIFSLWRAEQMFDDDANRIPMESSSGWDSFSAFHKPSEVRSAVQHEDGTRWLTVRFMTGVMMTAFSALAVSAVFFMFIPRMWVGADVSLRDDSDGSSALQRKTGLVTSVRLGELGAALESTEPVFEIQLTNIKTGQPISAQDYAEQLGLAEPLFRGAVLTSYGKGQWISDLPAYFMHNRAFERPIVNVDVRQDIRLAPSSHDILYCLGSPISIADSKHHPFGEINEINGVSSRGEGRGETGELEYRALTSFPTRHRMNYKLRVSPIVRDIYRRFDYLETNRKLPNGLKRLKVLTNEILAKETGLRQRAENLDEPRELTPMEMASALESYLRDSGHYQYSLDLTIDDATIDPVEDFLFNRKEGDCQYFGAALALMMRAARIPARLVSGYKGGIVLESKRNTLEVQQRFAHLWVEAWIDNDGWTTFDATPADDRLRSIASVTGKKSSIWAGMQTTLSGLWSENVLNLTLARQEKSIYRPLRELAYSFGMFVRQLLTSPTSAAQTLWEFLSNREQWFSVGGGIFAGVFLGVIAFTVWFVRWLATQIRLWTANFANRNNRPRRRVIEFYERFTRLMNSRGLQRGPTQTQHEFAEQVCSAFSPELGICGLNDAPNQISNLFYQVRFGDQELSPGEVAKMEASLQQLESALGKESNGR